MSTGDRSAGNSGAGNSGAGNSGAGDRGAAAESPSFSVAMEELESILERIDSDGIDIDQLATELRRATELLEVCRGKIRKAEVEVNQIVQQLEESSGE